MPSNQVGEKKDTAVVLRHIVRGEPQFSLYTRQFGRLLVHDWRSDFTQRSVAYSLPIGSFIECSLECSVRHANSWFLRQAEVCFVPTSSQSRHALYWLHHFLELYYYFIPLEQPGEVLFDHLCMVLVNNLSFATCCWKKEIIRFFILLGEHVPDKILSLVSCCQNNTHDTLGAQQVKTVSDGSARVDKWIVDFIRQHPYFKSLKTVQFFSHMYPLNRG